MLVDEKPSLDEVYLEHVGVKGMKWGVRKDQYASSGGSDGGFTITQRQKRQAIAAVGAVAVGSALYATGNLKAALTGTSKLAITGTVAATRIIGKVGVYSVKTVAQTAGVILGTTAKSAGNIAAKTIETVANSGKDPAAQAIKSSGRQRVADLASKLRPRRTPKPPVKLYPAASLLGKRAPKPPLRLYPTESIFGQGRGNTRVTDIGGVGSGVTSFTDRLLRRGRS